MGKLSPTRLPPGGGKDPECIILLNAAVKLNETFNYSSLHTTENPAIDAYQRSHVTTRKSAKYNLTKEAAPNT